MTCFLSRSGFFPARVLVCLAYCHPLSSWGQRISQRTFLKRPDSLKNVPIYAICLSLYEPIPGVTSEQIGSEVIRTQWLYVTLLATFQYCHN